MFAIEPLWLGELVRGAAALATFGVGFGFARWRWKRGERDAGSLGNGLD